MFSLASVALFSGCSSSDDEPDKAEEQAGSAGSGNGGTSISCTDDSDDVDLDGLYALSTRLSFTFTSQPGGSVAVCPADQTSEGYFLSLVKIEHQRGQTDVTSLSTAICSLDLPVISAMAGVCDPSAKNLVFAGLQFPEALIDALPWVTTGETTALLSMTGHGANFNTGAMDLSIGTDEKSATAPKWLTEKAGCGINDTAAGRLSACDTECVSECSKVLDDDKDGWPGVTLNVCGYTSEDRDQNVPCNANEPNIAGSTIQGRAFMNLMVEPLTLTGEVISSCEIAGSLEAGIGYNVIGADLYLANTQFSVTSAIKSLPQFTVNEADSRFRLVRIDGKYGAPDWGVNWDDRTASCRKIITNQNELR